MEDEDKFLRKLTEGDWEETRTLNVSSSEWVPKGKLFIASGQPLRLHNPTTKIQSIEWEPREQED